MDRTSSPAPRFRLQIRWLLLISTLLLGAAAPPARPDRTLVSAGAAIDQLDARQAERGAAAGVTGGLALRGSMRHTPPPPQPISVDPAYHTYAGMVAEVQRVAAAHPGLVQLGSIGSSYEGRALLLARVAGPRAAGAVRPEALLVSHYHAREHLTVEMMLAALHLLADRYGQPGQERITRLLDQRVVWLVFDLNPDGGEFDIAEGSYRGLRKNREPNLCPSDGEGGPGQGTDLNRNHSYRWGGVASSDDPCSVVYRGPAPASAPEVAALERFVRGRVIDGVQRITVALSFHTYGEMVLWPYGYTREELPPDMDPDDHAAFVALGRAMAATNNYTPSQAHHFNPTSGDFNDWAYGEQRIFAYTFELYPPDFPQGLDAFYPPGSVIQRETARNFEALLYLLEQAACPYLASGGAERHCVGSARFRPPQRVWLPNVARP